MHAKAPSTPTPTPTATPTPVSWQPTVGRLGTLALVGLFALTWCIVATGHLGAWDATVRTWLARPLPGVTTAASAVSITASAPVAYPILAIVGSWVALRERRWTPLILTFAAAVVLGGSVYFGKLIIGRPRPRLGALPRDPEPSFPSGHTTTAVVLVGVVLILTAAAWSRRGRRVALVAYGGYVALVGMSRVVLGVHWFSDVLAGWLLGTVIVAALALVYDRRRLMPTVTAAVAAG